MLGIPNFNLAFESGNRNPFSLTEVCEIFGIEEQTVRRLVRQKAFPSPFHLGRNPFWNREAIRKHITVLQKGGKK